MYKKIVSSFLIVSFLTMQAFLLLFGAHIAVAQQAEPASIVISAVQITGGVGKTSEDFIELYNASAAPVNLNGFRLVKRTATASTDTSIKSWTTETIIQPYHFYLWANSSFTGISVLPDAMTTSTLADNNGIALRQGSNDTGVIYDSLAWGNTANGFENTSAINPGAGESLVRADLFNLNSGFSLRASSPRNSTNVLTPVVPPADEPPVDEPPIKEPPVVEPPVDEPPIGDEPPPVEDQSPVGAATLDIKITEIVPNPSGEDSGFEKVELLNSGAETVNLSGLTLDDVTATEPISSNAYVLPDLNITSGQYLEVAIPAGKFALNNTDGDVLTIFDKTNKLLSTLFYEGSAPENKSYSYFSTGWQWAPLTFGQSNGQPPSTEVEDDTNDEVPSEDISYDNSGLIISEIFPQPEAIDAEFVEIYNNGSKTAQLSQVKIVIGARQKLLPEHELRPGEYYVIEQSFLPLQLRNSGQEVKLLEESTTLSTVTYPMAVKGASFAKFEDGFLWTTKVTKSTKNILQLPEDIKKKSEVEAAKTTAKQVVKKSEPTTKKTQSKTTDKTKLTTPVAPVKPQDGIENKEINEDQKPNMNGPQAEEKAPLGKIIAMGAAAVSAGIIALYKLVFTPGVD